MHFKIKKKSKGRREERETLGKKKEKGGGIRVRKGRKKMVRFTRERANELSVKFCRGMTDVFKF